MSDDARRVRLAEELLRHLAAATKAVQLYAIDHPIVTRAVEQLSENLERSHVETAEVVVGIVGHQVVVDGIPLVGSHGSAETIERFQPIGVERIAFARGVTREELLTFVRDLGALHAKRGEESDERLAALSLPHILVSRLKLQHRMESGQSDIRAIRESYTHAVAGAEAIWEQARAEGSPDPGMAIALVDGLATAVGQNRRAMIALTALYHYDNYTFTHMVNVSTLTMAQARSLGIDGTLLRQFGLAGLMHDIGKIRTPIEIIRKPDRLTAEEFAIVKKHPVDGAEMLRQRLELPPIAAVVAFEHHLRLDQQGYPAGVVRPSLNLATQLCAIADLYDAMRSQRTYQGNAPSVRILGVLKQSSGTRFDPRLVRRFGQLMGIYPVGNLVRLDNGALAVVLQVHAPDPSRPAVRVIVDPDGRTLAAPYDLALWSEAGASGPPPRIVAPVDPEEVGIDPLPYLDDAAA
jgi:putative nucleotidyltransferase with HDIG domain